MLSLRREERRTTANAETFASEAVPSATWVIEWIAPSSILQWTGAADVGTGVTQLRGNMKNLADAGTVLRGNIHDLTTTLNENVTTLRGGQKAVVDFSKNCAS